MKFVSISLVLILLTGLVCVSFADNVTELITSTKTNYEKKKYYKALEDLRWAEKEISNLFIQSLKKYLPANVADYTNSDPTGGDMFSIQNIERNYSHQKDSMKTVKISILSGSSATGTSGMGAFLGGLANLAAMSSGGNSEMVVTQGQRGTLTFDPSAKNHKLVFSLDGKVSIIIETNNFDSGDEAKKFANMIDFDGLSGEFQ